MTGVSLVLTGMLTPSCAGFSRGTRENQWYCTYESDDIRMVEVSEKLEFLDIHYQTNIISDPIRVSPGFSTHLRSTALGTLQWRLSAP